MAFVMVFSLALPRQTRSFGKRKVAMEAIGPRCGFEVVYRRSWEKGTKSEQYSVHAENIVVDGMPAYQSISSYPDRVRHVTMLGSDLSPLHVVEQWNDGSRLVKRIYRGNRVRVIRRNLPDPIDKEIEVPRGVHDPESFAFLLKGYPFEDQESIAPINVLVAQPLPIISTPRTFSVNIIPRGEERIKVPAGAFDCYVLEMGLAGLLGLFVPENRFWLLKDDPHIIIKAEGAGETIELVNGPFPCEDEGRCQAGAVIPDMKPEKE